MTVEQFVKELKEEDNGFFIDSDEIKRVFEKNKTVIILYSEDNTPLFVSDVVKSYMKMNDTNSDKYLVLTDDKNETKIYMLKTTEKEEEALTTDEILSHFDDENNLYVMYLKEEYISSLNQFECFKTVEESKDTFESESVENFTLKKDITQYFFLELYLH